MRRRWLALPALALLAGIAALIGAEPAKKPVEGMRTSFNRRPKELARVTFAIAGDIIPHGPVKDAAKAANQPLPPGEDGKVPPGSANHDGWDALFSGVADIFKGVDFGFVNLETPIAPKANRGSKAFQFNAPPALLDALQASGVKVVSFANNHVMDQGHDGFAETQAELTARKLPFAGAGSDAGKAWEPVVLEKNGIKVCLVGVTRWLNGYRNPVKAESPHVAFVPYDDDPMNTPGVAESYAVEQVARIRPTCDLVAVSIHWGVEYAVQPRVEDVAFARALLDGGADLIIGHHPHVLQPVETYVTKDERDTFIFYSLGNFVSNQARNYTHGMTPEKTGEMRDSLIGFFSAVKTDYGAAGVKVELGGVGLIPVWGENNQPRVKGAPGDPPRIRPILIDREMPKVKARVDELQAKGEALTKDEKKELTAALKRLELLRRRRELILNRTGDEYLVPTPPEP